MTQIKTKIPAELEPAAVGGMVTDSKYVKDRVKNKTQEEVNADTEERVSTLEESVGTGGSVDERIAVEKNRAKQAEGVLDDKIATEKQRAEGVEGGLNTRLQTVEQLAEISVGGGDIGIGTAADFESEDPEDLAKVPTVSAMLGGANDGVYDISARHSGTKYADLAAALGTNGANVPVGVRKGGMSVKFVQSSDNNYVQYRYMLSATNNANFTNTENWQGIDNEPADTNNLVDSRGVYNYINDEFIISGNNETRVNKKINLIYGHRYKLIISNPNYTYTAGVGNKFFIAINDGQGNLTNYITPVGSEETPNAFYYIVNNQTSEKFFMVGLRADSNQKVYFTLLDVTYCSDIIYNISKFHTSSNVEHPTWFSLTEALSAVPNYVKEGNLIIEFENENGLLVKYRLLRGSTFTTDEAAWVRIEDVYETFDASYNDGETPLLLTLQQAVSRIPEETKGYLKNLSFIDSLGIRRYYKRNAYPSSGNPTEFVPVEDVELVFIDELDNFGLKTYSNAGYTFADLANNKIQKLDSNGGAINIEDLSKNTASLYKGRVMTVKDGEPVVSAIDYKDVISYGFFRQCGYDFSSSNTYAPTTETTNDNRVSAIIPCTAGDIFCISGVGTVKYPLYVFVGSDNTIIEKCDSYFAKKKWITAPIGATKIFVQLTTNLSTAMMHITPSFECVYKNVDEKENEIENTLKYLNFEAVDEHYKKHQFGLAIDYDTRTIDITKQVGDNGVFDTYIIPCAEGDIYRVNGVGGGRVRLYAFIDTNGLVIETSEASNGTAELYVKAAPKNTAYLIVNVKYESQYYVGKAVTTFITQDSAILQKGLELLDEARAKVLAHNKTVECVNFADITDTHINGYQRENLNAQYNLAVFKQFVNENIPDFAIHTGDVYTSYMSTQQEAFGFIDEFTREIGNTKCDMLYVKGNHDNNPKSRVKADMEHLDWEHNDYYILTGVGYYIQITESQWDGVTQLYTSEYDNNERISRIQWYLLTENHLNVVHNASDYYGGYFYKDYKGVRAIVLNVYDTDNLEVNQMTETQKTWFANVALNTELPVLVFSHTDNQDINTCLADFIRNGGTVIAHIKGHLHQDIAEQITVGDTYYNSITVKNGYGLIDSIALDNTDAFCFSIFSVDLQNRKLYETRVGTGSDRSYDF